MSVTQDKRERERSFTDKKGETQKMRSSTKRVSDDRKMCIFFDEEPIFN